MDMAASAHRQRFVFSQGSESFPFSWAGDSTASKIEMPEGEPEKSWHFTSW